MKKKLAPLFVVLAGTLWGVMGIFARHFNGLELKALDIGWIRVFFGFLAVGIYLGLFHRELLKIRFEDLWCFLGTGICSLFLMNLTYYTAIEKTSLAVAGVLLYTAPIFVMLASALLFREKITGKKVLAFILAFLGCGFVSGLGSDSSVSLEGFLWGIASGLAYASYSIFGRYVVKRGYGAWTMIFYTFLFCLLAHSVTCDWHLVGETVLNIRELPWTVGLGVVTAFLPFFFYSSGLAAMENSRASILASVEPVVATLTGVLVFRETLSLSAIFGIGLVLSAVIMLSLQRGEKR